MTLDDNQIAAQMWEAVKAAIKGGEAILRVYESDDFDVSSKSDDSPLTRADIEAHNMISSILKHTDLPILSEEGKHMSFEERKNWDAFWMVDPLDGTKEFIKRNGEFTVNIALIEHSYPRAGVIYVPVSDELFVGIAGIGAKKIEGAASVLKKCTELESLMNQGISLPIIDSSRKYTVVCSRSHMSPETEAHIEELKITHGDLEFASRGSSLKLCMVAEGKADVYPRFAPTMEWDTAAGQAIAEASGADVINADTNKRLNYNKENLLNSWFIVKR